MTTPSSATYSPQQIAHLGTFLQRARDAYRQGNLFGARNAVAQYYRAQMPGGALGATRGYAGLAYGVASDTGIPGRTALGVLDDVGGTAVTPEARTRLMMGLANADLDTIKHNGGGWPRMDQIEDYHYHQYIDKGIPVEAWGGAALAHDGERWDGGALTPAELGDGSHSTAYQSMTPGQVMRNAASVLTNGAGQTVHLLAHTIHPLDSLPSMAEMSAAGDEIGAMAKAGASEVGDTLDSGWASLKTDVHSLVGAPASSSPPPSSGSSSAAPDGGARITAALSGYDPATFTDDDEAELTPDSASWNALLNGAEPDLVDA